MNAAPLVGLLSVSRCPSLSLSLPRLQLNMQTSSLSYVNKTLKLLMFKFDISDAEARPFDRLLHALVMPRKKMP